MAFIAALVVALASLLGSGGDAPQGGCVEDEMLAVTAEGVVCVHVEGDGFRFID